jgi:WD40 repeat protein
MILRGHTKSVKHITFHPNGNIVTTSSSDGSIYVFSITSEEATLIKKLDGIIPMVEVDSETSSKVAWHPDGSVFAAPTTAKGIPNYQWLMQTSNSSQWQAGKNKSSSKVVTQEQSQISHGHPTELTSQPPQQMEKSTSGKPKIKQ